MDSQFQDKTLNCKDCQQPFTFTAGEQDFFAQKQLHDPIRCKPCRQTRRAEREGGGGQGQSQSYQAQGYQAPAPVQNARPVVMDPPPPQKGRPNNKGGGNGRGGGGNRKGWDRYED